MVAAKENGALFRRAVSLDVKQFLFMGCTRFGAVRNEGSGGDDAPPP